MTDYLLHALTYQGFMTTFGNDVYIGPNSTIIDVAPGKPPIQATQCSPPAQQPS